MSKKGNGFVKKAKKWYPGLEEYNFVFMETKRKEWFKKNTLEAPKLLKVYVHRSEMFPFIYGLSFKEVGECQRL